MDIKKFLCITIMFALLFSFCAPAGLVQAAGTTYYISQSTGNDNNNGTSSSTPWKTLSKASRAYSAGDQILLKCGDTWTNETLTVSGDGTSSTPILLSSYGTGNKPVLTRTTVSSGQICVDITNPSGWKITNLKFDTGLFGIYLHWDGDFNNDYIWVENCEFYNFDSSDYTYGFPCGIWFKILNGDTTKTYCSNITVKGCYFQDCLNGVDVYAFNSGLSFLASYLAYNNVEIYNNYGYSCGSCPVGVANTTYGSIHDNIFVGNGDHYNSTGSCAGFLMWTKNYTIERNEYAYSKRIGGDGDGCAFDFEAMCDNVTFRDNFIHDTDGTGIFLYNNGGVGGNTNMHIINNLLSNDGLNPPDAARRNEICYGAGSHSGNIDNNIFYLAPGVVAYNSTSGFTLSGNIQTDLNEVNGTNLASAATATASSQYSSSYSADKAKDGSTSTCWKSASGTAAGEWLQLDFGSSTTVNKCEIVQDASSSISRYVVQYWDSGSSTWKDAFNGLSLGSSKLFPIKSVTTQKLRIYVYSTNSGSPAISEFKAYNVTHAAPTPTPTPSPTPGGSTIILDNDDPSGVSFVGAWTRQTGQGYNNSVHFRNGGGSGSNYVTFTPNIGSSGSYNVYARWEAYTNRPTNVPFTVYYNGGSQTITQNQQINGNTWILLGTWNFAAGTGGYVKLSDNCGTGDVIADAVKFELNASVTPTPTPTPTPGGSTIILDNDDQTGISFAGSWLRHTGQGYNSSVHSISSEGSGSNYVTFTPNIGSSGNYNVYARWTAYTNRPTNVPFTVYYNGGNQTITQNQQQNGDTWVLLGTWNFAAGTGGYVKLSDNCGTGDVIADAVKFEPAASTVTVNDTDSGITYSGFTYLTPFSGYYNNDLHYTLTAGSYAQFTFTGTSIQWIGAKNNNHGKVDVYIDGTLDTTIDTYDPSTLLQQVLYTKSGLAYGSHTIKIVQRSDKNPSSTNYYTDVDAFQYSN